MIRKELIETGIKTSQDGLEFMYTTYMVQPNIESDVKYCELQMVYAPYGITNGFVTHRQLAPSYSNTFIYECIEQFSQLVSNTEVNHSNAFMNTYGDGYNNDFELSDEHLEQVDYDIDYDVLDELANEYPDLLEAFIGTAMTNMDIFAAKMLSYGLSNIALGTTMDTPEQRKMSLDGIVIRMMDKISRLKRLVLENKDNTVPTESIKDTLADLANYAMIADLVLEDKWR